MNTATFRAPSRAGWKSASPMGSAAPLRKNLEPFSRGRDGPRVQGGLFRCFFGQ
jgi:hypothetical protein